MSRPIISLEGHPIGERHEEGLFIVVEGLDGSGKTTQGSLVGDELRKKGRDVITTKEPTASSSVAQRIANALAKKVQVEPEDLQELFTADREEHVRDLILPALQKGQVIVCDRYAFSTLAYGSLAGPTEFLLEINKTMPLPDLTLFVDVKPEECLHRIGKRGKPQELFEEEQKLQKIREAYLALSKAFPKFKVIDGSGTIQKTHASCMKEVSALIP